ncbi:MAG: hypothetical protein ACI8TL_001884 [Natronomonas sp.]|jgi:hypothetical protein
MGIDSDQLREELHDACTNADYPVGSAVEVISALPNGVQTEFQAGDRTITVADLVSSIGDEAEFPYESPEELVDHIMAALDAAGSFE